MQIAIDGPAGAGKSTVARILAKEKNYVYVDTGAMYRAMALYMKRNDIDIKDEVKVSQECVKPLIDLRYEEGELHIYLDYEDVSLKIRTQEVGEAASVISAYAEVRKQLVYLQRQLASDKDVVMDGRDIGTNVLPEAELKIYLNASAAVRAERRAKELLQRGEKADLEIIKAEIEERDYRDKNRKMNPLRKAEDALEIDCSDMSIDEVIEAINKEYSELCR